MLVKCWVRNRKVFNILLQHKVNITKWMTYMMFRLTRQTCFSKLLPPVCTFCQNWERMPPAMPTSGHTPVRDSALRMCNFCTTSRTRVTCLGLVLKKVFKWGYWQVPHVLGAKPKTTFFKPSSGNTGLLQWSGSNQNLARRPKPWRY